MKQIKRCSICNKRMWWWQAMWDNTFHFKCVSRMLRKDVTRILKKAKKEEEIKGRNK